MSKPGIVMCVRVKDKPEFIVPDSIQLPCDRCGELLWVAPSSQNILAEAKDLGLEVLVLCFTDMLQVQLEDEMSDDPGDGGIVTTPDRFIEKLREQNSKGG